MYFSTYNVYDTKEIQTSTKVDIDIHMNIETSECLICWEPATTSKKMYKLKELVLLPGFCECNGSFHKECFIECIVKMKRCPICRKKITCRVEEYIFYNHLERNTLFCRIIFYGNIVKRINLLLSCILFLIIVYIFTSETVTYIAFRNKTHNQTNAILHDTNDSMY
jgi:hypothetical protein